MINIQPFLKVGVMKGGRFKTTDTYDFVIVHVDDPNLVDSANEILRAHPIESDNYAELKLGVPGVTSDAFIPHDGFVLATFKKIKLKGKGHRWILS
jgi:hypothetical protein